MFEPRFSRAAQRLEADDADLWQVHTEAMARHANGEDVIVMSVGDPDLPTIDPIIENAVTSLYRGRTHYSPGMGEPALRKKIAEIETEASGKPTTSDEVIIFPGATNAIYSVLRCLLDSDSELLITEPTYVGYQGIFKTIGCTIVSVPTIIEDGFAIDVDAIVAAVTPATRVVLLNTPGNPSGNVIAGDDLARLAEFTRARDIWLVCDEVYSMLTFEKPHVSARRAADNLDNVIIVDGLSKSHSMTGWRLGWVVAPENAIPTLLNFTSATVFGCSQFIQDAAAFALENDAEYIAAIRQEYRKRRDYAVGRISSINGLQCHLPDAGMFLMLDVSNIAQDGESFARQLLDEVNVSVLPGSGFGEQTLHHVRLSLTHDVEVLASAFDRIETMISGD
ncbi:MAG TPA: pyridoxal phosphate-dependent aminotransferase [Gammaproteobacteria bacterium]|nr:pyridoxal phosphate-dependent aminotransferase [Gammaproteobacteria bacterium]